MADTDELLAAWSTAWYGEDEAWSRVQPGPSLAAVAARLSSVPQAFLDERVSVQALAGDILGTPLRCLPFQSDPRVRLGAAIGLWLCASESAVEPFSPALPRTSRSVAVDALALRVASVADPIQWLSDDERRTEATRTFLLWCGCLPAGEDEQTARSLLAACDSLARDRALSAAYEGHQHRAEIARRLADARRKEAAARYSSE